MKFINLSTTLPSNKLEQNLKKEADYYAGDNDRFNEWSFTKYNKMQKGIHTSYNNETKKLCVYYEDGVRRRNFPVPITQIFTGKIKENNGMTYIKGRINLSALFNVLLIFLFVVLTVMYELWKPQRSIIAIVYIIFIVYYLYMKKTYRDLIKRIEIYLDACTQSKKKGKKNNPNKKKGKWAGRHY